MHEDLMTGWAHKTTFEIEITKRYHLGVGTPGTYFPPTAKPGTQVAAQVVAVDPDTHLVTLVAFVDNPDAKCIATIRVADVEVSGTPKDGCFTPRRDFDFELSPPQQVVKPEPVKDPHPEWLEPG